VDPFCAVIVYAVVDDSLSRHLLGDSIDVFVRRADAERFIEEVRGDNPELGKPLRIEERELRLRFGRDPSASRRALRARH
jgi:hypothetical protein